MADKRSGPPSRGGFGGGSKNGFSKGGSSRGGPSRGGPSRGGSSFGGNSRGGAPRGGSSGGGFSRDGAPSRGGFSKGGFGDRPQRGNGFGDRPQRGGGNGGGFDSRPRRDFGDRDHAPRGDKFESRGPRHDRDMPFEERPRRSFKQEGFGASRRRDDMNTMRPNRDDRAPRGDRGFDRGNDRNNERGNDRGFDRGNDRGFGRDNNRRDFGDRPQRGGGFGDRPQRGGFGGRDDRRDNNRDGGFEPRKFESRKGFDKRPSGDRERPMRQSDTNAAPREFMVDPAMEKSAMKGHELVMFGVHAVQAALRNPKRVVTHIWVTDTGAGHLENAFDAARHPEVVTITRREIEQKLPEGAVHQGIAIAVEPLEEMYLSDVLAAANSPHAERQLVVVLDEVTDPHNVGAIMRSMSMFGAKALIVHKRNAPSITGTMAKIATGAVEYVPMIPVTNLAKAMEELKMSGFFCLGLDEDATIPVNEAPKEGHLALILGAEGDGLREKTRTTCDAIASIPSLGEIKSLNVSNAAAIALFSVRN